MAETNKSGLISSAEVIEELNADTLISVAAGADEPQKNAKLSSFASALQKEDSKIPTAKTMEFVRALDAEGKPILISKKDLATVVAELIGNASQSKSGLMPFEYIKILNGGAVDFNQCKTLWKLYTSVSGANGPANGYVGFINIGYNTDWFMQIACVVQTGGSCQMYRRAFHTGNTWTAWKTF